MAVTVEQAIEHARDIHPALDPFLAPDPLLLRFLSRYQQRLLAELADLKRDLLKETYELDLAAYDFEFGEQLPEYLLVHGGTVVFTNSRRDPEPFELVPYRERLDAWQYRWGGYLNGEGLLLLLGREADWNEVSRIDVHYFPKGALLALPADAFVLPGMPLDVLAEQAAYFLARRLPKDVDPPVDKAWHKAEALSAEEKYIDQVTGRNRAVFSRTQTVW